MTITDKLAYYTAEEIIAKAKLEKAKADKDIDAVAEISRLLGMITVYKLDLTIREKLGEGV